MKKKQMIREEPEKIDVTSVIFQQYNPQGKDELEWGKTDV